MPINFLFHIPRRTVRAILIVATSVFLVFIGLTRTKVGREVLRAELEHQFTETFNGRLELGELSGNLIYDLYASDVKVYAPNDSLVVQIDSVVIHPLLSSIFRRSLSIQSLVAFDPNITARFDSTGQSDLERAFKLINFQEKDDSPPLLFSADASFEIEDATVSLHLPDTSLPKYYQNFSATNIYCRAAIEWTNKFKLFDLLELSGIFPELPINLEMLRGQFVLNKNSLAIKEFLVQTNKSEIAFSLETGDLDLVNLKNNPEHLASTPLKLVIQNIRIDPKEFLPIYPDLPIAKVISATAKLNGTFSEFVVEHLLIQQASNSIAINGNVFGFPNATNTQLDIKTSKLDVPLLSSAFPNIDFSKVASLSPLTLHAQPDIQLSKIDSTRWEYKISSSLNLISAGGNLSGQLNLESAAEALSYQTELSFTSINPGIITQNEAFVGDINGHLKINSDGFDFESLQSEISLSLAPSSLANRSIDSLLIEANLNQGRFGADLVANFGSGNIKMEIQAAPFSNVRTVQTKIVTEQLNLGPILLSDSLTTNLNTQFDLYLAGNTIDELEGNGTIHLDSSIVTQGSFIRTLPTTSTSVLIQPLHTSKPRINVDGDIFSLKVFSNVSSTSFKPATNLWRAILDEVIAQNRTKLLPETNTLVSSTQAINTKPAIENAKSTLITSLRETFPKGSGTLLQTHIDFEIKRGEHLGVLLKDYPDFNAQFEAHLSLTATPEYADIVCSAEGETLNLGSNSIKNFRTELSVHTPYRGIISENITISLNARSDSLSIIDQRIHNFESSFNYTNNSGGFSLSASGQDAIREANMSGLLQILQTKNRITLTNLKLTTPQYIWSNFKDEVVDFYANGSIFNDLVFSNIPRPFVDTISDKPQSISLSGTLSSNPNDKIDLSLQNVTLDDVINYPVLSQQVGGVLSADLEIFSLLQIPKVVGKIDVDSTTLGAYRVGKLSIDAGFSQSDNLIPLTVKLKPEGISNHLTAYNDIEISGTITLPNTDGDQTGNYNLKADINQVDLFFFEYIFDNVLNHASGIGKGTCTVTGEIKNPIFDADVSIIGGEIGINDWNLDYTLDGSVDIDESGFHLQDIFLTDQNGGIARVDGGILFNNYDYFSLDLNANVKKFLFINVPNDPSLPFYGNIWATGELNIVGPISHTVITAPAIVTTANSELFIPVKDYASNHDETFIVFTDSSGKIPDEITREKRKHLLERRKASERGFVDGLELNLNIIAQKGATVHLVFDSLLDDVVHAIGSGNVQVTMHDGTIATYGRFYAESGSYQFSAQQLFTRHFNIGSGGSLIWDGDPLDPKVDIPASYKTRASTAGLYNTAGGDENAQRIPMIIHLNLSGRISATEVTPRLSIDRSQYVANQTVYDMVETVLNRPELATEYATSVLLTNSFLLTTNSFQGTGNELVFNSLSQLVTSQINHFVGEALSNVDLNLDLQGESTENLDLSVGIGLRFLNERLIIRGEGLVLDKQQSVAAEDWRGEFTLEYQLTPGVAVELFYRREDVLSGSFSSVGVSSEFDNTYGVGINYQTEFANWQEFKQRLLRREIESDSTLPADSSATTQNTLISPNTNENN